MREDLRLSEFDAEFAARTTPQEWARIAETLNRPRYLDGVLTYDALIPAFFSGNVILNRAAIELSRFQMIVYTLHLYDTADPADPRTGLTYSRLRRLCVAHDLASPGGVAAFIGLMLLAGYLRREASSADKRIVHLVPTQKFIDVVEGWNACIFDCVDAIYPESGLRACHTAHPRFGWDTRERGAQTLLAGWKPLDPFPEAKAFISSQGGFMLLLRSVADTIRQGNRAHIVPVSVDLVGFGRQFGVSRSQLRRLLETAHRNGLLDAPPRNGSNIVLSRRLLASFLAWMASELGHYHAWGLAARDALGLRRLG